MAKTTWKRWAASLIGAAINSAAGAITMVIVDPVDFNLFQGGARELGTVMLVQGIIGAGLYIKQHPVEEIISADEPAGV